MKAIWLYWEQGYVKTSIYDFVEHMGTHRRSLYDTFGDRGSTSVADTTRKHMDDNGNILMYDHVIVVSGVGFAIHYFGVDQ